MITGHIYQKLTSVRSPRYKRECFDIALRQVQATDFEGAPTVATPNGILHRPSRRVQRDMAMKRARIEAAEQRAGLHGPMKVGA